MKKKLIALAMASVMVLSMTACGSSDSSDSTEEAEETVEEETEEAEEEAAEEESEAAEEEVEETEETDEASDVTVMTYAEYAAAEVDTEVVVETWIQARQSWWESDGVGQATFYTQDEDGGYFLYNMSCTEDEYNDVLTVGTKIRVTGYKSEWSGEVEIIDATWEVVEADEYIAEPVDVTDLLGTDELEEYQNQLVSISGLTVESEALYKWDGSGSQGDDLYFDVSLNGETYTFTVESYLCDSSTEVYQAVEALSAGDVIDLEGFLYWYEGAQPHVTSVTAASDSEETASADGVMSYAEYAAADVDEEVVVETWIQARQSWWESDGVGQATFYTQDEDGGYFLYNLPCTEDEYNDELTVGTKIRVTGYKAEWSGEVEIIDATWEVVEADEYIAEPVDVTDLLGTDDLTDYQNQLVSISGLTVESEALYKWDGSGSQGDDLYFDVSLNGETYTFTVESYLCDSSTEVYQAVEALSVGDVIDLEGFLYWYEGAQPHVTSVTVQ